MVPTNPTQKSPAFQRWLAEKEPRARLHIGLSFRNLDVYGFTSSAQTQATVASYVLTLPRFLVSLLTQRNDQKVQILKDFDGFIRDGEMLLVLGRPGSGCTTLLKSLAGDTHGIYISREPSINYQGIAYEQFHKSFKGESIYLAETDVHFPELTLGDTLDVAAATCELGLARVSVSRRIAHDVAAMFGLDHAFDTPIGNAMIKGCSGGEKRRASIAEALVGGAQLQCWDNSTRGLDSSTALKFVELLRESTDKLRSTVVMTIYQASDSIYQNFNTVTVLYEGRQIYFGPTESAVHYFYELGFQKPPRATTPDFLTSLTNPPERIIRDGYEDRAPRSADDFVAAWKQSAQCAKLLSEIEEFDSNHPLDVNGFNGRVGPETDSILKGKLSLRTSTYVLSASLQILVCLRRAIQRFRRQPAPVIGAILANAILALVVGSVYYKLAETSDNMDKRAVLIFFSVLVTALSPAFEVLTIWAQRPIVEKHDRYAFYFPFTDAVASMICDLPNKLITVVLFQITIYFMTNLRQTPAAFFVWLLFNFVLVLNMSMWFRLIGSISRTMEQSTAPTCILVLLWCTYAGFVVPIPYMVGWLKWFRFVNPIAYAYESVMINEFRNRRFPCSTLVPSGPSYTGAALESKICTVVGASAGQSYVDGNVYLAEKFRYFPNHLWRNLGIIIAMTTIVCVLHLICAQYIPAERSKGDIQRFRHPRDSAKHNSDTETGSLSRVTQDIGKLNGQDHPITEKVSVATPTTPVQSSLFHWNELSYEVKLGGGKTKKILDRIDGWVKPGSLTALMGMSGAGKTTLLDVLANRADFGIPSGIVGIGGKERNASFQRRIGYAQQDDIHLSTSTVREALEFSASLRQSETSSEKRLSYVNEVIRTLDMESYADAVVGIPGDGLNIEQRKRLTIGVELVAKPELLLFLDEPTSGLDSQTAWSICTLLRKLATSGQTVLCTIHQPSSQLFLLFDRLLLLNDQGQTIYFGDIGPDGSKVIEYFEKRGAQKCDEGTNPAEWMLAVSNTTPDTASNIKASTFWANEWSSSQHKAEVLDHLSEINAHPSEAALEINHKEYAASWITQMRAVTKRSFQEYWRSPPYLYSKVALCAGVALFNGLSFQNTRLDIQGLQNLIFSMFLLTQMFGTVDQQVIPRLIDGRSLFESRERRSKTYSWTVFLASNIIVELVWQTLAAVLVFVLWYYPTGLWRNGDANFGTRERGALTFFIIWLYCLWTVTFSQAAAASIEHAESAVQLATLIFWFSLVFCGALVSPPELPGFWKFVWRASPLTYLIDGLATAGLLNVDVTCSASQLLVMNPPQGRNCGDYLAAFIQQAGGTLANPAAFAQCQYCPISTANSYLYGGLAAGKGSPWVNVGYFAVFNLFDILATFFLYWLVRVMPKKRK
ncbi:ABC-2 type transporter-domain-containing protein [Xylaria sp. CBS 124048]|nr:ABC-2 type transporter-domain-containing protein [Xylaria sp. CBS 124048]